jgi:hypothetical protein
MSFTIVDLCDLSNTIKNPLNVSYDYKLVVKINWKKTFFY